jgi:dihydrofolate reductase
MEVLMKTIVTTHWVSLDGYVAGPDGSMDWIRADSDMERYELDLVGGADTLLLGRGTYEDFAAYWPLVARDGSAEAGQRRYAQRLDEMQKVAVSRTLSAPAWPQTELMGELSAESVGRLKAGDGAIVVYGSVQVVSQLVQLRLVDEIHLLVHPLTLGSGTRLFDQRVELERVRLQPFSTGVALMVYRLH